MRLQNSSNKLYDAVNKMYTELDINNLKQCVLRHAKKLFVQIWSQYLLSDPSLQIFYR